MPSDRTPEIPNQIRRLFHRFGGAKLLAAGGATVFALTLAVGAGAAPSPFEPVSQVLGLGGEHGAAVSQAVHEAQAAAKEAGEPIGPAVSEAACTAAHDRSTLPHAEAVEEGEDEAVGEVAEECIHPSNIEIEDVPDSSGEESEEAIVEETDEPASEVLGLGGEHGAAVSQAVHEAKANLEEGEKVGPAVSEAACTAAHDRSTLPEGAQNAPGQEGREPKDCTHPSNADDADDDEEPEATSEVEGGSNGHGKQTAPGQLKKQVD
jgi:cytochrome c5